MKTRIPAMHSPPAIAIKFATGRQTNCDQCTGSSFASSVRRTVDKAKGC